MRLRLFDILPEGPQTLRRAVARLALSPEATARLLGAPSRCGWWRDARASRYGLGELGAALVGNPGVAAMVEHHALLYADLRDPVALLRGGRPTRSWLALLALRRRRPAGRAGSGAGGGVQRADVGLAAAGRGEILDAYPLARHRCLLDVGGGEGAFLAPLRRAPRICA